MKFLKYNLSKKKSFFILFIFLIVILLLNFLFFDQKLIVAKDLENYFINFKELSKKNFVLSILIFLTLYIIATSLSLPIATSLTLFSGAIFGWLAIPIIIFSATTGATIVFYLVQSSIGHFFINKIEKKFFYLKNDFKKDSFYFLLSLRLLPIMPFFLVNILAGLFRINLTKYILATSIGILPASTAFIWTGKSIGEIISYSDLQNLELIFFKLIPPLTIMAIISLLPIFLRKKL